MEKPKGALEGQTYTDPIVMSFKKVGSSWVGGSLILKACITRCMNVDEAIGMCEECSVLVVSFSFSSHLKKKGLNKCIFI